VPDARHQPTLAAGGTLQRQVPLRTDDGANLGLIGLVEHRRGTFVVSCTVPIKTAEQSKFRLPQESAPTALTVAPAVMREMTSEGAASLELMMLSVWRDLIVADVRDQQYEVEVVRKAKGKARKGRTTEVVRYLPRRVALRRAERAALRRPASRRSAACSRSARSPSACPKARTAPQRPRRTPRRSACRCPSTRPSSSRTGAAAPRRTAERPPRQPTRRRACGTAGARSTCCARSAAASPTTTTSLN
jgi:hypothetical protein